MSRETVQTDAKAPETRPGKPPGRGRPAGRKLPSASQEARKLTAGVLEVLSGNKSPGEVAGTLGISLSRYYIYETRALEGMMKALEPRDAGSRAPQPERERERLKKEVERLTLENARHQALVRAAQRTVGLAFQGKTDSTEKGKKWRRPRKKSRALTLVRQLQSEGSNPTAGGPYEPWTSADGCRPGGKDIGLRPGQRPGEGHSGDGLGAEEHPGGV